LYAAENRLVSGVREIGGGPYRVLPGPEEAAGLLDGRSGDFVQLELQDPTASRYVWVNPANVAILAVPERH
jgi:hypothetical protein